MDDTGEQEAKLCNKCGAFKMLSAFRLRRGKPDQPCKKCALEYGRRHYRNNKQYYIDKADKRNAIVLEQVRRLVWAYLHEHPCVDCGNTDPRVMEFDHVRGTKKYNVSEMQTSATQSRRFWKRSQSAKYDARTVTASRHLSSISGINQTWPRSSAD